MREDPQPLVLHKKYGSHLSNMRKLSNLKRIVVSDYVGINLLAQDNKFLIFLPCPRVLRAYPMYIQT